MNEYRIIQVDAFADRVFSGNPAAVVPLDAWLPDETMQAIANENNLSETAFTVPAGGDADYDLRWFTPTTEVALCGHATLASGHVLIQGNSVRFRTRTAGILVVGREGEALTLDLPRILVKPSRNDAVLKALGLTAGEFFISYAGAEATAVILLANAAAVRACAPDMKALGQINLMVIVTAPGDGEYDVVSRVFVPAWGVEEDPVTGSAHAALAPFWCDRLGRDSFTAYQASKRGGRVECRMHKERVILGGKCVTVIEGIFRI